MHKMAKFEFEGVSLPCNYTKLRKNIYILSRLLEKKNSFTSYRGCTRKIFVILCNIYNWYDAMFCLNYFSIPKRIKSICHLFIYFGVFTWQQ